MSVPSASEHALDARGLVVEVEGAGGERMPLVRGVDLTVARGEVLGLVGRSGSGKSLSALACARLLPPSLHIRAESVRLGGDRIDTLSEAEMRRLRGGRIGFVFQDPLSSLNPSRRIGSLLVESLRRHQALDRASAQRAAVEALREMRLPGDDASARAFPHQLSGGQRQRAMIALALVNRPDLLIADEPTTALDPTVQVQILALLKMRARDSGMLLITHDIKAAAAICDRIAVMHEGRIVESGPAAAVLHAPTQAYTRELIAAARLGERPAFLGSAT